MQEKRTWKLTELQKDEAARLYDSGLSARDVAHRFGISKGGMLDILRRRTTMRPGPAAQTHCKRGHLLAGENVYMYKDDGKRRCRMCARLRARGKPRRQQNDESRADWVARNPEKRRAHWAVDDALRAGRLVKPDACERCGATGARLHGHHEDYTKRLDVEWLCPLCHAGEHVTYNIPEAA
jgi:hypothetical protein